MMIVIIIILWVVTGAFGGFGLLFRRQWEAGEDVAIKGSDIELIALACLLGPISLIIGGVIGIGMLIETFVESIKKKQYVIMERKRC